MFSLKCVVLLSEIGRFHPFTLAPKHAKKKSLLAESCDFMIIILNVVIRDVLSRL